MQKTLEEMAEAAAVEHGFAVTSPGMPTMVSRESLAMFAAGYRAALPETTAEEVKQSYKEGDIYLVCKRGNWRACMISDDGVFKWFLSGKEWILLDNEGITKFLGPLRPEVLG